MFFGTMLPRNNLKNNFIFANINSDTDHIYLLYMNLSYNFRFIVRCNIFLDICD